MAVKNLPASTGDLKEMGLIPGWGRSLGEGKDNSFQYSCLGNSMDGGAWRNTVHGIAKSRTWWKWLSTYTDFICIYIYIYIYIIRTIHFLKETFERWFIHLKESVCHLPWMDHFFPCVRGWSVRGILTFVGGFNGQLLCWKFPVWAFVLEMGSGNEGQMTKLCFLVSGDRNDSRVYTASSETCENLSCGSG